MISDDCKYYGGIGIYSSMKLPASRELNRANGWWYRWIFPGSPYFPQRVSVIAPKDGLQKPHLPP